MSTPIHAQREGPAAKVDSAKAAAIRGILDQTKFAEMFKKSLLEGITQQERQNKDVPKEFWKEFRKRAEQELPVFRDELVAIYDRHFTAAEIHELAAFYRTPLGKKVAAETPAIQSDAGVAGRLWGERLGKEVAADLQAQGKLQ
jgi:hypothetical protein